MNDFDQIILTYLIFGDAFRPLILVSDLSLVGLEGIIWLSPFCQYDLIAQLSKNQFVINPY